MDLGFVIFVGTMLFFAALHQWPPDGRRWQRRELDEPAPVPVPVEMNAKSEVERAPSRR